MPDLDAGLLRCLENRFRSWLCSQSAYEARALDGSQRQPVAFTYEQVIRNHLAHSRLPDIDGGLAGGSPGPASARFEKRSGTISTGG